MPKITLKHSEFEEAIQRCSTIVPANASPIVLKYCRLRCLHDDQKLYIHATDGKTQVSYQLPILSNSLFEEDFDILIDPKMAIPLLPAIKSDEVEFECDIVGAKVIIEGGGHKFTLLSQPPEDFPKFMSPDKETPVVMPAGILKKMLQNAFSVINKQETRQALTCASFEYTPSNIGDVSSINVVGVNAHTVIFSTFQHDLGDEEINMLIRCDVVPSVIKILDDVDDVSLQYKVNDSGDVIFIFFKTRKCEIGCTPVGDSKFPNWDKIVPSGVKKNRPDDEITKIAIPAEAFKEAMLFAQVLADKEHKLIKLTYEPVSVSEMTGRILLESKSDSGEAKVAPIEARMLYNATEPFENYFAGKLLNDVVTNLHGNDLIISRFVNSSQKPMRFDSGNVGSDVLVGGVVAPLNPEKLK